MTNKTVAAATLGCKVNFYETEAILGLFKAEGYKVVDFSEHSDVYIINTCTVTNQGDKKSRQMIRRAAVLNPDAVIAAVGCYVQAEPDTVSKIDGVSLLMGTKDRSKIVSAVEECLQKKTRLVNVTDYGAQAEFEKLNVNMLSGRQRAFIKIQDGCDRYCAYCIIPYVRGPIRSRPLADIAEEARTVAKSGHKEIVLSGIHVSSYGRDTGSELCDAIAAVSEIEGIKRVRMSSLEPTIITERFVNLLGRNPKICDHFHLSLQSGCDRTLKRMNRRYTAERYAEAASLLRGVFPDIGLTTDVIVGFPGETDEDFEQSLEFCRRIGLSRIHVFPYSAKKGTRAYDFPENVPEHVKTERVKRLSETAGELSVAFAASMIGKDKSVLFERRLETGEYIGYTTNYIPVARNSDDDLTGKILNIKMDEACVKAKFFDI